MGGQGGADAQRRAERSLSEPLVCSLFLRQSTHALNLLPASVVEYSLSWQTMSESVVAARESSFAHAASHCEPGVTLRPAAHLANARPKAARRIGRGVMVSRRSRRSSCAAAMIQGGYGVRPSQGGNRIGAPSLSLGGDGVLARSSEGLGRRGQHEGLAALYGPKRTP